MKMLVSIAQVEKIAHKTKLGRLIHNPYKYLYALLFRKIIYPITKQKKEMTTDIFSGGQMRIALPASTDIYLTGGKSHDSEIRLARLMMQELTTESVYIDIGAHYGYFSIIAAECIGAPQRVYAFEPAPQSYAILAANQKIYPHIEIYNMGIGDRPTQLNFYQFPNLYSEYNAFDIEQYKDASWFAQNPPQVIPIESTTVDIMMDKLGVVPTFIKIDVEGFEDKVMHGAAQTLERYAPTVVMEFVAAYRHNAHHIAAQTFLQSIGYKSYVMDAMARLIPVEDIGQYLDEQDLESDNIVFKKKGR